MKNTNHLLLAFSFVFAVSCNPAVIPPVTEVPVETPVVETPTENPPVVEQPTQPSNAQLQEIGKENAELDVTANTRIRYGVDSSRYVEKIVSGKFTATNEFFGSDPASGLQKTVWIVGNSGSLTNYLPPSTPEAPSTSSNGVNQYLGRACEKYFSVSDSSNGQLDIKASQIGNAKVVCIKAGTYSTIGLDGLTGTAAQPIIIQNEGLVQIDGRMFLGNMKYVVVSGSGTSGIEHGFLIRDTKYRGLSLSGKFHTFTLQNIEFRNVPDYVISWDRPQIAYDGTPNTAFYMNKFLRIKSTNSGSLMQFYSDREGLKDIHIGTEIAYCEMKDSPYTGSAINLAAAFQVDVHHNKFINVNYKINEHSGMIFLNGDGKLHHNYFQHTLGNSMRTWPLSLGAVGKLDIYNNIAIDTVKYSLIEVQPFQDHLDTPGKNFTNIRIYHNTAGNLNWGVDLPAGPGLWTAGLVDTYSTRGDTMDIQNNLIFNINNPRDAADPLINGQGNWPASHRVIKNNLYFASASAAGLIDAVGVKPKANSPVVAKGDKLNLVTDDYLGKALPSSGKVDIGAVQH